MKFRDLTIDEIEVRVQSVKPNGIILLLYKNARCDMNILDETVGAENWTRRHYECKGNLFCEIGINKNCDKPDHAPDWTFKGDCGTESNTEKEKGEASDSFKRAGFNWGIGRELYTSPFMFIPITDKDGKPNVQVKDNKTWDKFSVEKIKIDNGKITAVAVKNDTLKKRVFVWQKDEN